MKVVKWHPFMDLWEAPARLGSLHRELDRQWDWPEMDLVGGPLTPAVDIYETKEELVVKADLPDFNRKSMSVSIENGILTLRGEKKFEEETNKDNYHRVERQYGAFVRSFSLPDTVDQEKVKADYKEGVLKIRLPKKPELKAKAIDVQVADSKS